MPERAWRLLNQPAQWRQRLTAWLPYIVGGMAALSTFYGLLLIVDGALFALVLYRRRLPPWWAWAIAGLIGITALWSSSWWWPLWTAARVLALGAIAADMRGQGAKLLTGYLVGLAPQTFGLLTALGADRPPGLAGNPSLTALAGVTPLLMAGATQQVFAVAAALAGTAGLTMGLAAGRVALLASMVAAAGTRSRAAIAAVVLAGVVLLFNTALTGTWARYLPDGIGAGITGRVETLGGDSAFDAGDWAAAESLNGLPPARVEFLVQRAREAASARADGHGKERDIRAIAFTAADLAAVAERYPDSPPRFTALGYGFGAFVDATHRQGPHTVPVLAAFELGLLAVPLFGLCAWWCWRVRPALWLLLALGALWLFSYEHWGTGAGMWLLAVTAFSVYRGCLRSQV